MKHLKYLLLLFFILVLSPNAYAYTYDVTNKITAPSGSGSTGGHYLGLEIYNSGSQNNYTVNTRYNGTLSNIEYNLLLPTEAGNCFTTNMEYTVTMEMATSDWRNHFSRPFVGAYHNATNWAISNVTFVSQKKIYFRFKIPSTETSCYSFVYVTLDSSNVSNIAFTGVTNWNLSKISLTDQYSSSGGSNPTPTPSPNSNQEIINNQNNNTNSIINNQNDNTSNVIENNNENTEKIIDSNDLSEVNSQRNNFDTTNLDCGLFYKYNLSKGKGFYTNGNEYLNENMYYTEDYIPLNNATKLVLDNFNNTNNGNIIIYDNSKNYLDYWGVRNQTITLPNNAYYFRYSTTLPLGRVFKDKGCTSKLDEINDYLTDNSNPNISDSEFTSLFDSVSINNPLSSLLQLPVQFINAIVNQSNSCQVVNLGTLLGVSITLPCIDIGSILGSTVWNTIDILSSIGLIVLILKQLYESITNALTLGGYMDAKRHGLGYMPPLEFLCSILTIGEVDI